MATDYKPAEEFDLPSDHLHEFQTADQDQPMAEHSSDFEFFAFPHSFRPDYFDPIQMQRRHTAIMAELDQEQTEDMNRFMAEFQTQGYIPNYPTMNQLGDFPGLDHAQAQSQGFDRNQSTMDQPGGPSHLNLSQDEPLDLGSFAPEQLSRPHAGRRDRSQRLDQSPSATNQNSALTQAGGISQAQPLARDRLTVHQALHSHTATFMNQNTNLSPAGGIPQARVFEDEPFTVNQPLQSHTAAIMTTSQGNIGEIDGHANERDNSQDQPTLNQYSDLLHAGPSQTLTPSYFREAITATATCQDIFGDFRDHTDGRNGFNSPYQNPYSAAETNDDLVAIKLRRHVSPDAPNQTYQGIIKSESHYFQLFAQYMSERDHPHGDVIQTDIPSADEEKEQKKRELYDVLTAQYPDPVNFQTIGVRKLHPDQVEFTAYGTLLCVIRMSQGVVGAPITHKDLTYKAYESFTDRWDALIELLKGSRAARFELLTKPGMMERFAANPTSKMAAKGVFARNNLRRNAEGKVARELEARQVIKKRKRADGGWDIVSHTDENVVLHSGPAPTA